nr:V-type proton ATPase catalytic subunit A [Ipomoea batatas]
MVNDPVLRTRKNVIENSLVQHHVTLHPDAMGKITYIGKDNLQCTRPIHLEDTVLELEFQGVKKQYTMLQTWPVCTPRPVAEKLAADTPLLTGQYSNTDTGCGERGNEMAENIPLQVYETAAAKHPIKIADIKIQLKFNPNSSKHKSRCIQFRTLQHPKLLQLCLAAASSSFYSSSSQQIQLTAASNHSQAAVSTSNLLCCSHDPNSMLLKHDSVFSNPHTQSSNESSNLPEPVSSPINQ